MDTGLVIVTFQHNVGHDGGEPCLVTGELCPISETCEITEVQTPNGTDILLYLSRGQITALENALPATYRRQLQEDDELSRLADYVCAY